MVDYMEPLKIVGHGRVPPTAKELARVKQLILYGITNKSINKQTGVSIERIKQMKKGLRKE